MARRATPGNVVALDTSTGAVFVHYLGKHPQYGDGVNVSPTEHPKGTAVSGDLFREAYFTFFPVSSAVARGLGKVVGDLPAPGMPSRMRRAGARSEDRVETWIIEDGSSESVTTELSEADRKLPIAAIWNIDYLLHRVAEGWRPEDE